MVLVAIVNHDPDLPTRRRETARMVLIEYFCTIYVGSGERFDMIYTL